VKSRRSRRDRALILGARCDRFGATGLLRVSQWLPRPYTRRSSRDSCVTGSRVVLALAAARESPQLRAVLILKLAGRTPTRLIRGMGFFLKSIRRRVGVEIDARVDVLSMAETSEYRLGGTVLGKNKAKRPKGRHDESGDFQFIGL